MLRVGVIGCGSIARAHAVALRLLEEDGLAKAVAAADPDPAGLELFGSIAGGVERTYTNGLDLVDDPELDAIVIITPTAFHREYILASAAAGRPLFTEKPLAPTYPAVQEIADRVRKAGIPTQVGFQSRFHPLVRHVRDTVMSGEYGGPMAYALRDDQFWPSGRVVPGHTDWRSSRAEAGGGALLEHSIHSCDVLNWIFGPVRRVYAVSRQVFGYDVEDVAVLTIEHDSGAVGSLTTVFNGVRHREERRLEVFLEGATIELTTDFVVGAPEDSLLIHEGTDEHEERLDVDLLRRDRFLKDGLDPDREIYVYQYLAHRAFALALHDGKDPSPGIDDGLRAHQVVESAYRSAATGRPVSPAELERDTSPPDR
jgi:predicted dehydrogenase